MTDMMIEIMVEVLTILAIATKELKRGRLSAFSWWLVDCGTRLTCYLEKYIKKLTGSTDIEDSLERLDKLTLEEVRMASAELIKMTHIIDGKVMNVDDTVKSIEGKVQDVHGDVQYVRIDMQDVGNKVQGVDDRVQGIANDVQDISSEVRGVDDKFDQVNRSSSLSYLLIVPSAQTALQETNAEIVCCGGSRPQIHPSIITRHPNLITTVRLNGFFKAVHSISGNPPTPSCGYTENVRHSSPLPFDDP